MIPDEKFTIPFINFINSNFPTHHIFIVFGVSRKSAIKYCDYKNVIVFKSNKLNIFYLLTGFYTSSQIILHSLFIKKLVLILFFQPWLLKKCYWVIWGGDLYHFQHRERNFKSNLYEYIRKCVIKRIGNLITHIKGDYELAKKWYKTKGKYYYSIIYPSNVFKEFKAKPKNNNIVYMQIGNSADPTNNHLEIFEKIKKYHNVNFRVICPLSYGDNKYRKKIIEIGYNLFKENFFPIIDFMPFDEYLNLLANIDIAIFNHDRQQAVGNITTLLGLGKKVYLKNDITTWNFCNEHGLIVFDANTQLDELFTPLNKNDKQKNINNVKKYFSESQLFKNWNTIFIKE